jgi:hypothetical protein
MDWWPRIDIAGFTRWSSSRPPQNVFTLLESLYRRFDSKARARGVFKVETIGDCYMACAGLPKPREDHAVIMARFARDMLLMFEELRTSLAPTLGDEMMSLGLRVGIHSGKYLWGSSPKGSQLAPLLTQEMKYCSQVQSRRAFFEGTELASNYSVTQVSTDLSLSEFAVVPPCVGSAT